MKSIWAAVALIVAGLAIVLARPTFLADERSVGVFEPAGSVLPWLGWLLLIAGVAVAVLGFIRSRRNGRR